MNGQRANLCSKARFWTGFEREAHAVQASPDQLLGSTQPVERRISELKRDHTEAACMYVYTCLYVFMYMSHATAVAALAAAVAALGAACNAARGPDPPRQLPYL